MNGQEGFGIHRKGGPERIVGGIVGTVARATAALLLSLALLAAVPPAPASAQLSVRISVSIPPPPLPVYVQPLCPGPNHIWTPGFWAWDPDFGFYWVPGTWVLAPFPGWYWTPGYWAWVDGSYLWHDGYWGPSVGFYGGINYGFGYNGFGYFGGYWERDRFYYNRTVNNIRTNDIRTYYVKAVPEASTPRRVSFNGGSRGIKIRPTKTQLAAERNGAAPVPAQLEHVKEARRHPRLRASANEGLPPIAATRAPGAYTGPGVIGARRAGAPYRPTPDLRSPAGPGARPDTMQRRMEQGAPAPHATPGKPPAEAERPVPSAPERRGPGPRPQQRLEQQERFAPPPAPRTMPQERRGPPARPQGGQEQEQRGPRGGERGEFGGGPHR